MGYGVGCGPFSELVRKRLIEEVKPRKGRGEPDLNALQYYQYGLMDRRCPHEHHGRGIFACTIYNARRTPMIGVSQHLVNKDGGEGGWET